MFTVKKVNKFAAQEVDLGNGKSWKTTVTGWAVFDNNDNICMFQKNEKNVGFENYYTKKAAQKVADFFNDNPGYYESKLANILAKFPNALIAVIEAKNNG